METLKTKLVSIVFFNCKSFINFWLFLRKLIAVIQSYQKAFLTYLETQLPSSSPANLYDPARYILQLGGKRIRPILALMAADAVAGSFQKALPAALAVEIFHNFSLVHDDIMDEAPLRRGKPTVHEAWDVNTGILSGDVLLVMAYECFNTYPPELFHSLTRLFSKTAREVCEGQQYDMDFPTQAKVTQAEYIQMITYKTAVLLACSLQMGAMVGGMSEDEATPFYAFGVQLGLAFQLQDDYLDAFGDPESFGKQLGGDIIENKKTLLYLLALMRGTVQEQQQLKEWFAQNPEDSTTKIKAVKAIFRSTKADEELKDLIENYTQRALTIIDDFSIPAANKAQFKNFASQLMARKL